MSITLSGVGKYYTRWIFRGLTYTFRWPSAHLVTGPNGVGKSTLARLLLQFESPNEGTITRTGGERIAFFSSDLVFPRELSVKELSILYFSIVGEQHPQSWRLLLEDVGLVGHESLSLSDLSSGMRQRFGLGLAFLSAAEALIIDEPFANLDEKGITWCLQHMRNSLDSRLLIVCESREHMLSELPMKKICLEKFCVLRTDVLPCARRG